MRNLVCMNHLIPVNINTWFIFIPGFIKPFAIQASDSGGVLTPLILFQHSGQREKLHLALVLLCFKTFYIIYSPITGISCLTLAMFSCQLVHLLKLTQSHIKTHVSQVIQVPSGCCLQVNPHLIMNDNDEAKEDRAIMQRRHSNGLAD